MRLKRIFTRHPFWWIFALSIMVVLLLAQFGLPIVLRYYANAKINSFPGLAGEIGSLKLYFIPGEYLVQNVQLRLSDGVKQNILNFEELGARIYWKSLFTGAIEGDCWLEGPQLTIWAPKNAKGAGQTAKKLKQADWQDQVRSLMAFKINKFEIHAGSVRFRDPASKPPISLKIKDIELEASNLTNREELKDAMFAKITARAKMFGSGDAELSLHLDPLAKHPTFKLKSAVRNIDLTKLNNLLMAYGKFDVDRGNFSLFNEIVAKNGKFVAYAKPIFRNIDVRTWENREHPNNKLLTLWKNIVGAIVDVLKNKEKDQIATKIKAEGSFRDPDISVWGAIARLLSNGFIQALIPGYDKSIKWSDVP